jgi:uncharacterized protein (DUF1501 family)
MKVLGTLDPAPAQSGYLSRRTALLGGGAAVLATALVARGVAAAQDASPERYWAPACL